MTTYEIHQLFKNQLVIMQSLQDIIRRDHSSASAVVHELTIAIKDTIELNDLIQTQRGMGR